MPQRTTRSLLWWSDGCRPASHKEFFRLRARKRAAWREEAANASAATVGLFFIPAPSLLWFMLDEYTHNEVISDLNTDLMVLII